MEIIRRGNDINGEDIPECVLVEVLLRLSSPKIVCSFKLVSKQWLSIISDPIFVCTYISQNSVLMSSRWTFISSIKHHLAYRWHYPYNMVLDDVYSQVIKPDYCLLPLPYAQQQSDDRKSYMIEGVSNGLVLYGLIGIRRSEIFIQRYYICNPVTRSWFGLPMCTNQSPNNGVGFLTRVEDGVLINYTVVQLGIVRGTNLIRFEVFYSEIGEWKNYTVLCGPDSLFELRTQAEVVNGVLHWISSEGCIIAYDPYQSPGHVRVITLPTRLSDDVMDRQIHPDSCLCGEYKGKLRYYTSYPTVISGKRSLNFEVWVLNDDYIWSLQYAVSDLDMQYGPNISFLRSHLVALCFHPFDSDVVCMGSKDALISYNIKTKRIQVYQRWYKPNGIPSELRLNWRCAFLFVVPSWPISLSRFSSAAAEG